MPKKTPKKDEEVVIFTYTRTDALEDGTLIDVSKTAREAGIVFPTAVTAEVHSRYVKVPSGKDYAWQDETGRLWDLLFMMTHAVRNAPKDSSEILYEFYCNNPGKTLENEKKTPEGRLVALKAVVGPGDDLEPVITIMLPNQD